MKLYHEIEAQELPLGTSKIGSTPWLGDGETHPLDKTLRPMKLLVQLNFEQFNIPGLPAPKEGVLAVFISYDLRKCQDKDKNCFKVLWQPTLTGALNAVSGERAVGLYPESSLTDKKIHTGSCLLTDNCPRLKEAQAISAFSSNGITYNEVRAKDDCYAHLMADAINWRLLLRLVLPEADFLLMTRQEDLQNEQLEKSWLIRFYRE